MNQIVSKVMSTICNDDIYCQSYSDYMQSGINKLMDKVNMISQIVANESETIESEFGFDTSTIVMSSIDDCVQLSEIQDSIQNDSEEITTVKGNTITVDSLIDYLNEQVNCSELFTQAIRSSQINSEDTSAIVSNYTAKVSGILNNASGNLKSMADQYVDIMASRGTVREKLNAFSELMGFKEAKKASTEDEFFSSLATSNISQFTGVNPTLAVAAGIAEGFENIDWSSVKSWLVTTGEAFQNAWDTAVDYIDQYAGTYILNGTRAVLEATGITNKDFYTKNGGDGTVDNVFMSGYIADTDFTGYGAYLITIGGIPRSLSSILSMLKSHTNFNEWIALDIPGARIYFAKVVPGSRRGSVCGFEVRVRFRPIDLTTVVNHNDDLDSTTTYAEFYSVINQYSAYFGPNEEENFALEDKYFFDCCGLGKALSYLYCKDLIAGKLDRTYVQDETTISALKLGVTLFSGGSHSDDSKYINPTPSGNTVVIGPNTFADPTNLDFAERLSICEDGAPDYLNVTDAGTTGYFSTSILAMYLYTAASMFLSCQEEYDGYYIPYIKTSKICDGSYYINSDKDNYAKVIHRAINILAIAAVVGVTAMTLKISKKIKTNAVVANLKASISQEAVKEKLLNGGTVSKVELKSMYKATKKAVRLNKLTGGFASITTGLSTWSSESLISSGSAQSTQVQDISKLITG